jgi:Tfp pilus assembly protein PilF
MFEVGEDLQAARTHVVLALDSHPGKVDYLLLFASIQEKLGEKTDARRTCKKVLSLDPKNTEAREIMQRIEKPAG